MKLLFLLVFDRMCRLILFHGFDEFPKTERLKRLTLSHVELTVELHPKPNSRYRFTRAGHTTIYNCTVVITGRKALMTPEK